jgi:hypothetical protein
VRTASNASVRTPVRYGSNLRISFRAQERLVRLILDYGKVDFAELGLLAAARQIYKPRGPITRRKLREYTWWFMSRLMNLGLVEKTITMVGSYRNVEYRVTEYGKQWLAAAQKST